MVKDLSLNITVSVGAATLSYPKQDDMEALLALADQALYRAKAGGRNRVEGQNASDRPYGAPDSADGSDPA
jgi:diguanylate cyclase (GGDEF)-like protein